MLKATDKQEDGRRLEIAARFDRSLRRAAKRDACRTLAVLGDKSVVPSIEPLLKYPDLNVQKDAMDAIALLKAKP